MNRLIFEKVRNHLLSQGKQSRRYEDDAASNGNICAYRGTDGEMCAIGCLIDEEHYDEDLEDVGAGCVEVLQAIEASGHELQEGDNILLVKLQEIHDNHEPSEWETLLQDFEAKYIEA